MHNYWNSHRGLSGLRVTSSSPGLPLLLNIIMLLCLGARNLVEWIRRFLMWKWLYLLLLCYLWQYLSNRTQNGKWYSIMTSFIYMPKHGLLREERKASGGTRSSFKLCIKKKIAVLYSPLLLCDIAWPIVTYLGLVLLPHHLKSQQDRRSILVFPLLTRSIHFVEKFSQMYSHI